MKSIYMVLCFAAALLTTVSCKQENKKEEYKKALGDYDYPRVPQFLQNTPGETKYFVEHYWDSYPYDDSVFISRDNTEQILADFLEQTHRTEFEVGAKSMCKALARVDLAGRYHARRLHEIFLHYIDDPASQYYNRLLDWELHKQLLKSKHIDKAERSRYEYRIKVLSKNNEGTLAQNFNYVTYDGKKSTLFKSPANYTLLCFYDPFCETCESMMEHFKTNPDVAFIEKTVGVQFLFVYTGDDEKAWREQCKRLKLPKQWIVTWNYDDQIEKKVLYDLSARPSFYLLDKHKKVIMIDAVEDQFMSYLLWRSHQKLDAEKAKKN